MKKYFTKIIAISLLVVVFPLATNFCFQGLLSFVENTRVAQAAELSTQTSSEMDMDSCIDKSVSEKPEIKAEPTAGANHNNSILPCCVDGGHPNVIVSSQSVGIEKFVPVILSSDIEILKIISKTTLYTPPIISPPKLLAVSTIILRL